MRSAIQKALRFIVTCVAIGAATQSWAVSCGDTVSTDLTLTADLHCTTGYAALLPTSGVTISLNGHTLSGTSGLIGIMMYDATNVTIKGPGTIKGFWAGVNGLRAHKLNVLGVSFANLSTGITLAHTQYANIANNQFDLVTYGVSIRQPVEGAGAPAGFHSIGNNVFRNIATGVQLCGYGTGNTVIQYNKFQTVTDYGIHFLDGTHHNQVLSNEMYDVGIGGVVLRGSSSNTIQGNRAERGGALAVLIPNLLPACVAGTSTGEVYGNKIQYNYSFKHNTAVLAGLGAAKGPLVHKNEITSNRFHYSNTGIFFLSDTYGNNGTRNTYTGTTTPIVDYGVANYY